MVFDFDAYVGRRRTRVPESWTAIALHQSLVVTQGCVWISNAPYECDDWKARNGHVNPIATLKIIPLPACQEVFAHDVFRAQSMSVVDWNDCIVPIIHYCCPGRDPSGWRGALCTDVVEEISNVLKKWVCQNDSMEKRRQSQSVALGSRLMNAFYKYDILKSVGHDVALMDDTDCNTIVAIVICSNELRAFIAAMESASGTKQWESTPLSTCCTWSDVWWLWFYLFLTAFHVNGLSIVFVSITTGAHHSKMRVSLHVAGMMSKKSPFLFRVAQPQKDSSLGNLVRILRWSDLGCWVIPYISNVHRQHGATHWSSPTTLISVRILFRITSFKRDIIFEPCNVYSYTVVQDEKHVVPLSLTCYENHARFRNSDRRLLVGEMMTRSISLDGAGRVTYDVSNDFV